MRWRPLSTQAPEAKARSIGFSIPRIASGIMWPLLAPQLIVLRGPPRFFSFLPSTQVPPAARDDP